MKKFATIMLIAAVAMVLGAPSAFADKGTVSAAKPFASADEQVKNVQRGATNVNFGWTEYMDRTHNEAAKGNGAGEQLVGVVAGSAIGVRKGIHRIGAGAIDLLTFWIPKKGSLINPEKPPVE